MSDRVAFYFRQRVSEDELNLAFEQLERADRNLAADMGVFGIVAGAEPAQHEPIPDLSIDLAAPGRAYDRIGRRIFFGVGQTVSCAQDSLGISTEVLTAGNERWLGVFMRFDRLLSDERTDGNSQRIFFRQDESFDILVRQAAEAPAGTAQRVPLEDDEILVCDVRRVFAIDRILSEHIDLSRRQALVFARGDGVGIEPGLWQTIRPDAPTVQSALDEVDKRFAAHVAGQGDRHAARHIPLAPAGFVTAPTVQEGFDDVAVKLGRTTAGSAGAGLIGADQVAGTPRALPAGTVDGQLALLLEYLNTHLNAASNAHAASAIRATPHNWITSESVQAQLQDLVAGLRADRIAATAYRNLTSLTVHAQMRELVDDLRSTEDDQGTALIGGAALPGDRSVGAGTLLAQLRGIVNQLNAHAESIDHDSRYLRRIYVGSADLGPNSSRIFTELSTFPDFLKIAYDIGTPQGFQRWFSSPTNPNIWAWVDKNVSSGVMSLVVRTMDSEERHVVVAAYRVG
jgi:hypothetical protein